jgi:hypothetical protein
LCVFPLAIVRDSIPIQAERADIMYNIHINDNSLLMFIDGAPLVLGNIVDTLTSEVGADTARELLPFGTLSNDGMFMLFKYRDHKGNLLTSLDPVECAFSIDLQRDLFEG